MISMFEKQWKLLQRHFKPCDLRINLSLAFFKLRRNKFRTLFIRTLSTYSNFIVICSMQKKTMVVNKEFVSLHIKTFYIWKKLNYQNTFGVEKVGNNKYHLGLISPTFYAQLLRSNILANILGLYITGARLLAQKLRLEHYWNWPLVYQLVTHRCHKRQFFVKYLK